MSNTFDDRESLEKLAGLLEESPFIECEEMTSGGYHLIQVGPHVLAAIVGALRAQAAAGQPRAFDKIAGGLCDAIDAARNYRPSTLETTPASPPPMPRKG